MPSWLVSAFLNSRWTMTFLFPAPAVALIGDSVRRRIGNRMRRHKRKSSGQTFFRRGRIPPASSRGRAASSPARWNTDEIRRRLFRVTAGGAAAPIGIANIALCHQHRPALRLDFVHVAGHQFDFGVLKRLPAVVVHRDPADQIHQIAFLRRDQIVARAPVEAAGDVTDFGVKLAGLVGLQQPVERGLENRVVAQIGKPRLARQAELQFAIHLDDGLLLLRRRERSRCG